MQRVLSAVLIKRRCKVYLIEGQRLNVNVVCAAFWACVSDGHYDRSLILVLTTPPLQCTTASRSNHFPQVLLKMAGMAALWSLMAAFVPFNLPCDGKDRCAAR